MNHFFVITNKPKDKNLEITNYITPTNAPEKFDKPTNAISG